MIILALEVYIVLKINLVWDGLQPAMWMDELQDEKGGVCITKKTALKTVDDVNI